jgi:hypothetical protein
MTAGGVFGTPIQLIAPMSAMLTTATCGISPSRYTHASGIVFGLDAVAIYSAVSAGGTAACNGTADNQGKGLTYDAGIPGVVALHNWTDALALLYGGLNKAAGITDCGSAERRALVANWGNLFQNHCANANSTCTTASLNSTLFPNGGDHIAAVLWHAFRPDDSSGTAATFAALIGLGTITSSANNTPLIVANVSSSANNGFGSSPYCNAINWDTRPSNQPDCALGAGKQFLGPGGVAQGICSAPGNTNLCDVVGATDVFSDGTTCTGVGTSDPVSGLCSLCNCVAIDSIHRRPPYLTWGTVADGAVTNPVSGQTNAATVLPTSYQDNDPIRHQCLGLSGDIVDNPGEEVCNRDGTLGVVLSVPSVDFVPRDFGGRDPFTGVDIQCGGNSAGTNTFDVFSCALLSGPAGRAAGGCANGDTTFAGGCIAATALDNVNTLCYAPPTENQVLGNYTTYDARIYNLTLTNGTSGYTTFTIPSVPASGVPGTRGLSLAFTGHYGRIHSQTVLWDKTAGSTGLANKGRACAIQDATDQLGCLVQADPCSVAAASQNAATWGAHQSPMVASSNVALRVSQIAPSTTTVRGGSYPLWRKLYLNASAGFDNLAALASVDAGVKQELELAEFESSTSSITTILAQYGFFSLGSASPKGIDTPFCEDFNEQLLCDGGIANQNACGLNTFAAQIPFWSDGGSFSAIPSDPSTVAAAATTSTVCGNGIKEAFEDCDHGLSNGTAGDSCTTTCRLALP